MTKEEALNEIKSWDFLEGKEIEAIETLIPELAESEDEKMVVKIAQTLSFAAAHNLITDYDELIAMQNWLEKQKESLHISETCKENPNSFTNEDERIRKRLIEYFEGFRMGNAEVKWEGLTVQEVLAWLEKQKETGIRWFKSDNVKNPDKPHIDKTGMFYTTDGRMCYASEIEKQKEQKHPNGCFTCDEYKKGYEEGRRNGFTAGYNKAMKEVEQKEQKPVVTHGETYHVDTLGTQQVIAGKMPQKPAEWSEEDEHRRKDAIYFLESAMKHYADTSEIEKAVAWLKSLSLNLKKKNEDVAKLCSNEWSEEDERIRKAILGFVNPDKGGTKYSSNAELVEWSNWLQSLRPQPKRKWTLSDEKLLGDVMVAVELDKFFTDEYQKKIVSWLRSFRPYSQSQWKPSNEQIGALNYAYCELFKREDVEHNILGPLQKLCDDLKKLR